AGDVPEGRPQRGARPVARLSEPGPELVGDLAIPLPEQRGLAREVEEEGRARDVGRRADRLDRDRLEAARGEELHRRPEDLAPGALLLARGGGGKGGGDHGCSLFHNWTEVHSWFMMRPESEAASARGARRREMKGAVFHGVGQPLTIEELEDPKPGPGELVLRVKSCGICGSDLHAASLPPGLPAGTVMGHEFAGEGGGIGGGTTGWKTGARACAFRAIGCGTCGPCLTGDVVLCTSLRGIGLGQIKGAYSEYVLVGGPESVRLPGGVSFREGALVEPLAVGLHAVNKAGLQPGERVMVIGAGPIGLAVTAWARLLGAPPG